MRRGFLKSGIVLLAVTIFATAEGKPADGNPIGDFFKRLGNSIAHPQRKPPPRTLAKKNGKSTGKNPAPVASPSPADATAPVQSEPTVPPAPTPTPQTVRAAGDVRPNPRRDVPYGVPVPGRPGFVTSPYAPTLGLVDVRGFPSGTEVKDPYTGKVFLTP